MTIRHHVKDELLLDYVSGRLGESWGVVVATHLTLCQRCRDYEAHLNGVGGFALQALTPVSLTNGALARCRDRIKAPLPRESAPAPWREPSDGMTFPKPLCEYVGRTLEGVRWRPLAGGLRHRILDTADAARARLLYLPAGAFVPEHGHSGLELMLVLAGTIAEGDHVFGRGDLAVADETVTHAATAGRDAPTVCLIASDGPPLFSGRRAMPPTPRV